MRGNEREAAYREHGLDELTDDAPKEEAHYARKYEGRTAPKPYPSCVSKYGPKGWRFRGLGRSSDLLFDVEDKVENSGSKAHADKVQ